MREMKFDEFFGRFADKSEDGQVNRQEIMAQLEFIATDVLANIYELWLEDYTVPAFSDLNKSKLRRLKQIKYAFEIDPDVEEQNPKN